MRWKILIGIAAMSLVAIAATLVARPQPCTGNVLQDSMNCNMIGEKK